MKTKKIFSVSCFFLFMISMFVGPFTFWSSATIPNYQPCNYYVTIHYYTDPSNGGTINGYSNGQSNTLYYNNVPCSDDVFQYQMQASPSSGFSVWFVSGGSLSSITANPTYLTVRADTTAKITAYFAPVTYSGTIYNEEGKALPGVVVHLVNQQNSGDTATTTTNSNGQWSATLQGGGAANAYLYWQSLSNGPELTTESGIPISSSYTVTVWETPEDTSLAYEFANTNESTIQITQSKTFTESDNVFVQGGISDGFLSVNAGGQAGTTLTIQAQNTFSDSIPYWAYYQNGISIKVEDVNGNYMIYKQQFSGSPLISSQQTSEYLTISQALSDGGSYVSVAPYGTTTQTISITGVVSLDAQVSVTALGQTLGTEVGLSNANETGVSYSIHNPYSFEQCFVVYNQGFDYHIWLYSNSTCP